VFALADWKVVIVGGLLLVGLFFAFALIYTAVGAFTGWVVGLTPLGGAVTHIWNTLTRMEVDCWQIGAFLGFLSGFFRGIIEVEKREN
jgi:ABC-type multidrug transport system permease subunit